MSQTHLCSPALLRMIILKTVTMMLLNLTVTSTAQMLGQVGLHYSEYHNHTRHTVSCHFAYLLAPLSLSMTRAWVVTMSVEVGLHESSGCEQQPPHLWTRVQEGITISPARMSATSNGTMVGSGIQAAGLASSLSPDNNVWNGNPALLSDEKPPGTPNLITPCFRYIFRIDSMYLR